MKYNLLTLALLFSIALSCKKSEAPLPYAPGIKYRLINILYTNETNGEKLNDNIDIYYDSIFIIKTTQTNTVPNTYYTPPSTTFYLNNTYNPDFGVGVYTFPDANLPVRLNWDKMTNIDSVGYSGYKRLQYIFRYWQDPSKPQPSSKIAFSEYSFDYESDKIRYMNIKTDSLINWLFDFEPGKSVFTWDNGDLVSIKSLLSSSKEIKLEYYTDKKYTDGDYIFLKCLTVIGRPVYTSEHLLKTITQNGVQTNLSYAFDNSGKITEVNATSSQKNEKWQLTYKAF